MQNLTDHFASLDPFASGDDETKPPRKRPPSAMPPTGAILLDPDSAS